MESQVVEKVITGMTKVDLAAVIFFTAGTIAALVLIFGYIMKLNLRVFQNMPADLTELNKKVKSGDELDRMIRDQVQYHELNCPLRAVPKPKEQGK